MTAFYEKPTPEQLDTLAFATLKLCFTNGVAIETYNSNSESRIIFATAKLDELAILDKDELSYSNRFIYGTYKEYRLIDTAQKIFRLILNTKYISNPDADDCPDDAYTARCDFWWSSKAAISANKSIIPGDLAVEDYFSEQEVLFGPYLEGLLDASDQMARVSNSDCKMLIKEIVSV